MADFNSSLPIRTETNGDAAVKIVDGTITSQALTVNADGSINITDNGGSITVDGTVTANQGTSPWVTKDQSDGPVTPGAVASFSGLVGGQYNATPPTVADTEQVALQVDSSGKLLTTTTSTDDHNYGTVGANTLRTAAQIGNATGAADFNFGTVGAQTLRTASEIGNATGAANFNYGTVGAQTVRTASQLGNATGAADFNFGTVGAQSLRTAAQIGNATGAADFNAGATGAQTLRTSANQGAPNTVGNAWPTLVTDGTDTMLVNTDGSINVVVTDATPGTPVNDYKRAIGVAAGASDNHDYTVTAGKTFYLNQIEGTGSGKAKMEVEIETGVATGTFLTRWVQFNSTGTPNMTIHIDNPIAVAAGVRVRVVMKNNDLLAQDMYSTISGYELP